MSSAKSKSIAPSGRPNSGSRSRRRTSVSPGSGIDQQGSGGYQIRTEAPRDDADMTGNAAEEAAILKQKFIEMEERRVKEWEDHQRAQRTSSSSEGAQQRKVFLDFSINDVHTGRLLVELLDDTVPETAGHFRDLCTGDKFYELESGVKLDYINSPVNKIVPGTAIYTGGLGNLSLSPSGELFKDESFANRHTAKGLLSMVNSGPNTNGSCFCITLGAVPDFDFHQVVFGRIVDNQSLSVLSELEKVPITHTGIPKQSITISLCGALSGGEPPRGFHTTYPDWMAEQQTPEPNNANSSDRNEDSALNNDEVGENSERQEDQEVAAALEEEQQSQPAGEDAFAEHGEH